MTITNLALVKQHILLIEDEPGFIRLIREALFDHPQITLHVVTDAVQALHYLTRYEGFCDSPAPSLVILDLQLPIFSGKTVLEERRRRRLCDAPVVVLTSSSEEEINCLVLGASEFHTKPDDWLGWQQLMRHLVLKHLHIDLHSLPV